MTGDYQFSYVNYFSISTFSLAGTFAVASLMVSKPVEEYSTPPSGEDSLTTAEEDKEQVFAPVQVATTLAFLIGILQVR